ncbi:hypothetical protein GCM10023165_38980 [Variovorax defluvii]|uniref:HipA-like C-terminal domain-containing protein n=1 Tax=Variovorax defluvii TaxID=913761 RepID=A0ABP8I4T0_9BURK
MLELLLFAGADRYGALGVSLRADAYAPWGSSPMPRLGELDRMQDVIRKVIANEPVAELEKRLLRPGVSLGGARPKSLIEIDGQAWLVKFGEGEDEDTPLIEHATMTLAARCGIDVAQTRALPVQGRHAVAVRRFDREATARVHAVSAHVILRALGEPFGYPQLAQQLRRLCRADDIERQQEQLFRRMVFNILMDNTDDHEKNHALLRQADGSWTLSPAYDMVPSLSRLGMQAMLVGKDGADSTLHNAVSHCKAFGMTRRQATDVVDDICEVAEQWKAHFQGSGVRDADVAVLAQYLDNDRLGGQRRQGAGALRSSARRSR